MRGVGSKYATASLNVGIEVSNIKAPWASTAAVLDVRNQTLLNKIAELPLADRQIFSGLFGLHEPWSKRSLFR